MQLTSPPNPIDDIIFIIEQNQSKCSALKHTISVKYAYENELSKITNQFIYELIFDLRNVLTMLDRLKAQNVQLNNKIHFTENELTELNAKCKTTQDKLYILESALNEADRRNKQLTAINQSNQNYIEELLLKLKLNNNCCCKYGNYQQQQVLNGSEVYNKNRSMITTANNVNESKQHSPLLNKTNRNSSYNKQYSRLHFDYDSISNNIPIKTNYQIYRQQSLGNMMNINNKTRYHSNKPLSSLSTTQYTSVFGKKNYLNNNIQTSLKNSKNETMKIEINSDSQRGLCENRLTKNTKQHSHNDNQKNNKYQQRLYHSETDNNTVINNKIKRVQQLVMKAFKNEDTLTQLKNKLGTDLETKLTNADVDEEYLNLIEQALNEINDGNSSSQNVSKRIQNQFENNPMNDKHCYKTKLKQEIVNKQNYFKEYPKKCTSLKNYFINNKPDSFNKTNFS